MVWFWVVLVIVVLYLVVSTVMRRAGSSGVATYDELRNLLVQQAEDPVTLIDVRTAEEYRSGHIPGAVNIPHDRIADRPPKASKDSKVVVYCHTGSRSVAARAALKRMGYEDVANFGRIGKWKGRVVEGGKPGSLEVES